MSDYEKILKLAIDDAPKAAWDALEAEIGPERFAAARYELQEEEAYQEEMEDQWLDSSYEPE